MEEKYFTLKNISEKDDLPSLPLVTQKIIQLTYDQDKSLNDIAKVVSTDAALTLRFLKLVNSSYYGYSQEIKDLNQALSILGITNIRKMTITVSLLNIFSVDDSPEYARLFKQALTTAVAADFISQIENDKPHPDAFLSALLVNVGAFIMKFYMPKRYDEAMQTARTYGIDEFSIERMLFHTDRVEIGVAVCKKWNLPKLIVDAIGYSYNIGPIDNSDLSNESKMLYKFIYLGRIIGDIYWTQNKMYKISVFKSMAEKILGTDSTMSSDILSSIPHLIADSGYLEIRKDFGQFPTFDQISHNAEEELQKRHLQSKELFRKFLNCREKSAQQAEQLKKLEQQNKENNERLQQLAKLLKK